MRIGFTGTRKGISDDQREAVTELLQSLSPSEAHHGDCIGADAEFHTLCLELNIPIVIHPPNSDKARAFCDGAADTRDPKPHLDRNHDIVDACDILIACPDSPIERRRSGTWATIRYARKTGKRVEVIPGDSTP